MKAEVGLHVNFWSLVHEFSSSFCVLATNLKLDTYLPLLKTYFNQRYIKKVENTLVQQIEFCQKMER